ncbi:SLBB domain-containing protein [Georgenia sp. SUBG003]|uniref:SLBB domain-containing protein n=1 Tax=Georgenia sp. SUBG003 TaxID=1497974 RepID=UPI003AB4F2BA
MELPGGARVGDAVDAAGGAVGDADVGAVNLARVLVDGEQVYVPHEGERPDALTEQGWRIPDAQGNFVWLELGRRATAFADTARAQGVLVRAFAGEGVRVSVGERDGQRPLPRHRGRLASRPRRPLRPVAPPCSCPALSLPRACASSATSWVCRPRQAEKVAVDEPGRTRPGRCTRRPAALGATGRDPPRWGDAVARAALGRCGTAHITT